MKFIKDLGMMFPTEKSKRKHRYSLYQCHCGKEFKVLENAVKTGTTKSCGCSPYAPLGGFSKHRLYGTWRQIIQRCENKNHDRYSSYGGRGIKVCDRWKDIKNFIKDMYPTFKEGLTIDRKDNDGNYEPLNCRWADDSIQTQNIKVIKSNNTSGYKGVHYCHRTGKWIARITNYGKRTYIGLYNTPEIAYKAYCNYIDTNNLEHSH